jgi:hypothetical protein
VLLARIAALAALAGCPNPELPTCHAASAIQAALVVADDNGGLVDVTDGSQVPLVRAPQGGHILLVGAKVMGAADCMLDATGALRDPATNRVIGLDMRPLQLSTASNGWALPTDPALSSMPNIGVCPSSIAQIDGHTFTLELTLVSGGTPIATLSAAVTPSCGGDSYCHSECTM